MSTGTAIGNPEKVAVNEHCKLRQSSEMVQSPEVASDKVWFLTLLREAHIWERVTLGAQVGGSNGGDGEGEGEGEEGEGESKGEDGDEEGDDEGDGEGEGDSDGRVVEVGNVGLDTAQTSTQCM